MPTKRRKIGPRRIKRPIPFWCAQLLAAQRPDWGPETEQGLFDWLVGDRDDELGLPPWESAEGQQLRDAVGL
jgi:hypothetical protein